MRCEGMPRQTDDFEALIYGGAYHIFCRICSVAVNSMHVQIEFLHRFPPFRKGSVSAAVISLLVRPSFPV